MVDFRNPSNERLIAIISSDQRSAYRRHHDIGVVLLSDDKSTLEARLLPVGLHGDPQPDKLAEYFANLAGDLQASVLLIDGPQGWKDPENGLEHSRVCERELNTPAKTGLPGAVKPANYRPFVEFSILFFDQLSARGWPRYQAGGAAMGTTAETFPLAAWRSLGPKALPAKSKSKPAVLQQATEALLALYPTRLGEDKLVPLSAKGLDKAWDRVRRRTGLLGGIHWLRHTFASQLVMKGAALRTVQNLMGHATIAVTERYAHLAPGQTTEAVKLISLYVTEMPGSLSQLLSQRIAPTSKYLKVQTGEVPERPKGLPC